jgi:CRP/FNR family transcriptional regulator
MSDFHKFKTWLKNVSFLTEEDCSLFENQLTNKRIESKQNFLTEGQICKEMAFINAGSFRIFYLSDDKEINTHFCLENDFVVEYDSFLQQKPSRYYIQALEDSHITTISLEMLQRAYDVSKNWERFGRMMAERSYKVTTKRVESFLFMDGEQRYLNLVSEEPHLIDRIPLYHIASYLGLERESLSRLRKKIVAKKRL